jgi:hypothetical protein
MASLVIFLPSLQAGHPGASSERPRMSGLSYDEMLA